MMQTKQKARRKDLTKEKVNAREGGPDLMLEARNSCRLPHSFALWAAIGSRKQAWEREEAREKKSLQIVIEELNW